MICFEQLRSLALRNVIAVGLVVTAFLGVTHAQIPQPQGSPASSSAPSVTLHWGARQRVSRYRIQVANDAAFTDIVLDRVVAGLECRVTDLPTGKYFWRVAPLGTTFNASSAGVIEIRATSATNPPQVTPRQAQTVGQA